MIIKYRDFNQSEIVIKNNYTTEWNEIKKVLSEMNLHIKESDQTGKVGKPIFDVVGTNEYIKKGLSNFLWESNLKIPNEYKFLGTDIDFGKNGIVLEVQFSNYPFLLNNVIRSELFYKSGTIFSKKKTQLILIITKCHMFEASNSTLYYEQAVSQVESLARHDMFNAPVRLIGLFEDKNIEIPVMKSIYSSKRYSRTVETQNIIKCKILSKKNLNSRCEIQIL